MDVRGAAEGHSRGRHRRVAASDDGEPDVLARLVAVYRPVHVYNVRPDGVPKPLPTAALERAPREEERARGDSGGKQACLRQRVSQFYFCEKQTNAC